MKRYQNPVLRASQRHESGRQGDPSNRTRRRPRLRAKHGEEPRPPAAPPSPARTPRAPRRGRPVPTPPGEPGRGDNCSTSAPETAEGAPLRAPSPLRMRPVLLSARASSPACVQGPLDAGAAAARARALCASARPSSAPPTRSSFSSPPSLSAVSWGSCDGGFRPSACSRVGRCLGFASARSPTRGLDRAGAGLFLSPRLRWGSLGRWKLQGQGLQPLLPVRPKGCCF